MSDAALVEAISQTAEPLPALHDDRFADFIDRFADHRVILLGEPSHGTAEAYAARAAITCRLVERHGFTVVAWEADWPDAASVHRYVRDLPRREGEEPPFRRFPTWMWRNTEIAELVGWLRARNRDLPPEDQVGVYGLDLYNLGGSIESVLAYLDEVDPEAATEARRRYGCLEPWAEEPARYGRRALYEGYGRCEEAVVRQCRELFERVMDYASDDGEAFLDAAGSARLIAAAEQYYRVMYWGGAESWNLRDTHMADTLDLILKSRGPDAKAVVWAHNSHIGDARATGMGRLREELNLGQLARERYGDAAALIGIGTHAGTVMAADDWGEPGRVMDVNPSRPDSWERLCHDTGLPRFLLDLRDAPPALREERLERFIGVIYRPDTELQSHYSPAALADQFDAWVWLDETTALTPLAHDSGSEETPDTFPFGE